jgi:diketogulonate reductase-like aldo/keto reductase
MATCAAVSWYQGVQVHDIHPASDLGNRQLDTYEECASLCCDTPACVAFFHTTMELTDAGECFAEQPCCWLKPTFNTTRLTDFCANPSNCMSGNVTHTPETAGTVKLNNGVVMPTVALGVWQYNDSYAKSAIDLGVAAGFRHIDTANDYWDQAGVGMALPNAFDKSGGRANVFVTSKVEGCGVPKPPHGTPVRKGHCYNDTIARVEEDLQLLNITEVDLMLLHWPPKEGCNSDTCPWMQQQWAALEAVYSGGLARAIGVSNYCVSCLKCLQQTMKVTPAVNQIQYHVGMASDPGVEQLASYCKAAGIQVQAYSPLDADQSKGSPELITGNLTNGIGKKYHKSGAQVALKFIEQQGIPLVTKAHDPHFLAQDIALFGWTINGADMAVLKAATTPGGTPSMFCSA